MRLLSSTDSQQLHLRTCSQRREAFHTSMQVFSCCVTRQSILRARNCALFLLSICHALCNCEGFFFLTFLQILFLLRVVFFFMALLFTHQVLSCFLFLLNQMLLRSQFAVCYFCVCREGSCYVFRGGFWAWGFLGPLVGDRRARHCCPVARRHEFPGSLVP